MKNLSPSDIHVPADVPTNRHRDYIRNYFQITRGTGRLMLFAGDQKIEHLNDDFYGKDTHADDNDPEHLFRIADKGEIGVFASQLGLISRYGRSYPHVPYLIKVNSKTHIVPTSQADPLSESLCDMEQIRKFRKSSRLKVLGVGYTIFLGSIHESRMLGEASRLVFEAHQEGLITVLWIYPRGKAIKDEKDPHLIAGAAGVAACLGADFVKVNYPKKGKNDRAMLLREAVLSAGRTKVVCAGGGSTGIKEFLESLHDQIHVAGAMGNATARNIHQKPIAEAIRMCRAISAITLHDKSVDEALSIYHK